MPAEPSCGSPNLVASGARAYERPLRRTATWKPTQPVQRASERGRVAARGRTAWLPDVGGKCRVPFAKDLPIRKPASAAVRNVTREFAVSILLSNRDDEPLKIAGPFERSRHDSWRYTAESRIGGAICKQPSLDLTYRYPQQHSRMPIRKKIADKRSRAWRIVIEVA